MVWTWPPIKLRYVLLAGFALAIASLFLASPAFATGGASLTVNSISRDASTGDLVYDVTAGATVDATDCSGAVTCYLVCPAPRFLVHSFCWCFR